MSKPSVEGLSGNFEQLKSPSFDSDLNELVFCDKICISFNLFSRILSL